MIHRPRAAGVALATALALSSALAPAAAHAEKQTLRLELREIVDQLFQSDMKACKSLNGRLSKAIADPQFDRQATRERAFALYAAILCAPAGGDQAVAAARRLAPIAPVPQLTYLAQVTLMGDALERDAPADFLAALGKIVEADPGLLADQSPRAFAWISRRVRDNPDQELKLLTLLHAVPWTDTASRDYDGNGRAVRLAQLLAEGHDGTGKGDMTKARILLEGVTDPADLVTVAQDRRFETLWPGLEQVGRFDWTKVAEAELATLRKRAADQPKSLAPVVLEIESLRSLERYDEAVALGEAHAARLRKGGGAFDDGEDQRSWLLNNLAYTLSDLGRVDEADALMREAIGDGDGISQNVNRAELLVTAGRPDQALKAIGKVGPDDGSPYGLMWVDTIKACAKAQLGDLAAAQATLDGMRSRGGENPAALTKALLCLDRQDEAAALYVKRLNDPAQRADALQAFVAARPPRVVTAQAAAMEARKAAVLARPEVQAAMKAHGRAVALPLAGNYWGSL